MGPPNAQDHRRLAVKALCLPVVFEGLTVFGEAGLGQPAFDEGFGESGGDLPHLVRLGLLVEQVLRLREEREDVLPGASAVFDKAQADQRVGLSVGGTEFTPKAQGRLAALRRLRQIVPRQLVVADRGVRPRDPPFNIYRLPEFEGLQRGAEGQGVVAVVLAVAQRQQGLGLAGDVTALLAQGDGPPEEGLRLVAPTQTAVSLAQPVEAVYAR